MSQVVCGNCGSEDLKLKQEIPIQRSRLVFGRKKRRERILICQSCGAETIIREARVPGGSWVVDTKSPSGHK